MNIGIPADPIRLVLPGEGDRQVVSAQGEPVASLTWPSYIAWRKTKCEPFDRNAPDIAHVGTSMGVRTVEEINHAILEFIGEVAELNELVFEHGSSAFFGPHRDKIIDECGDCFFCGCWAFDAWGMNPLEAMTDDLELVRVSDNDDLAQFAAGLALNSEAVIAGNARFVGALRWTVMQILATASTNSGLLANAFKKLKYQRREQSVEAQVERIAVTLFAVNQVLILVNSSVEEALKVNQRKLNHRFPDGYQGPGGGIRTGDGK